MPLKHGLGLNSTGLPSLFAFALDFVRGSSGKDVRRPTMSFLNWVDQQASYEVSRPNSRTTQLSLKLSQKQLQALCAHWAEVYSPEASFEVPLAWEELRLVLSEQWLIFGKRREGESRALIAHPAPHEWVATVALDIQDGRKLISSLRDLKLGQSLILSQTMSLAVVSNFDLRIALDSIDSSQRCHSDSIRTKCS